MKKYCFVLCLLLIFRVSAQQTNVVNPGFELWNSGNPVGWTTTISGYINVQLMNYTVPVPVTFNFGSRTNDANSGDYALKLKAKSIDLSNYNFPAIAWPGMAQLGTAGSFTVSAETIQQMVGLDYTNIDIEDLQNINWQELASLRNVLSTGDAFTMVPTAMKVWVKYLPPAGEKDTMLVLAGAYRTGESNMLLFGESPAAYAYYTVTERLENYTELTIPFEYNETDVSCDSLMIMFISSSFMHPKSETELYIDDISFEFDYTSVSSAQRVGMRLYPNPASDYLTFSPENQTDMCDLTVYDANGRQVRKLEHQSGSVRLKVEDLSSGTYFLKVRQAGNETVRKFVVE
ncbi:MAG: T9SS type A sorting domain-containing protein [Bacteroidales bacterium]|nr:T9SS type A sorting domain-containing protein [Bacteroidales bacterium]